MEGKKSGIKRVGQFFIEHPAIALVSCHTGKEGGPAQRLSEIYNAIVIGPSDATQLKKLEIRLENNKPKILIEYIKAESIQYEGGTKIIS